MNAKNAFWNTGGATWSCVRQLIRCLYHFYLVYDLAHSSWYRPVSAGSFNLSNDHYNNTGTRSA